MHGKKHLCRVMRRLAKYKMPEEKLEQEVPNSRNEVSRKQVIKDLEELKQFIKASKKEEDYFNRIIEKAISRNLK